MAGPCGHGIQIEAKVHSPCFIFTQTSKENPSTSFLLQDQDLPPPLEGEQPRSRKYKEPEYGCWVNPGFTYTRVPLVINVNGPRSINVYDYLINTPSHHC
ncbi:hypothetical protein XENTR_v10023806 [Xenopus tropicalis]|nr:hypothetical protein XENTR_v10023806 [Xenopus tropicalis]